MRVRVFQLQIFHHASDFFHDFSFLLPPFRRVGPVARVLFLLVAEESRQFRRFRNVREKPHRSFSPSLFFRAQHRFVVRCWWLIAAPSPRVVFLPIDAQRELYSRHHHFRSKNVLSSSSSSLPLLLLLLFEQQQQQRWCLVSRAFLCRDGGDESRFFTSNLLLQFISKEKKERQRKKEREKRIFKKREDKKRKRKKDRKKERKKERKEFLF